MTYRRVTVTFLLHLENPDHFDSVVGTAGQRWVVSADAARQTVKALDAWIDIPATRNCIAHGPVVSRHHARVELLQFVLSQALQKRCVPELPAWVSWIAFTSNYNFGLVVAKDQVLSISTRLAPLFQDGSEIAVLLASALAWFFGPTYLLFRAVRSADFNLFMELCKASEKTSTIDCTSDSEALYKLAYSLFRAGPEDLLLRAHKALHTTAQQHICYRGVSFPFVVELDAFVDKLAADGITEVCSCSLDGCCASLFADPRAGPKSVLVAEPRLRKNIKLRSLQIQSCVGAVVVFDGFPCATVSDLNTFSTAEAEV